MARLKSSVAYGISSLILVFCVQRTLAQCNRPYLSDISVRITPYEISYDIGSMITFSCNNGGDIFGPTSSSCQEDGRWDYTNEPVCEYCEPPTFLNPYAIVLQPDQPVYLVRETIYMSCEDGHSFPDEIISPYTTCFCYGSTCSWDRDYSEMQCYAQCDTTELLESDVIARNPSDGRIATIYDDGESASFSCEDTHKFIGQSSATCNNGSFHFDNDQPECLDPCPISNENDKDGLSYIVIEDPVINQTHVQYYIDGASILFSCSEGYTPEHCNGVCRNGSWDPRDFPSCIAIHGGLSSGAAAGISILTILLVASIVINVGLIFFKRSRSKDVELSGFTSNGDVQFVMNNNTNHSERPYTSLRFGPVKSQTPNSAHKRVTFLTKLGSLGMGDFGDAWKGEIHSTQETVLIRKVSDDIVKFKEVLGKVKVFSQLPDHPNIVKCLGYHPDQNIILYKFIPGGSLLTHLQMKRGQAQPTYTAYNITKPQQAPVDEVGLINFALQIAKGIGFLASKKIIHGSLCAHNVLLDEQKMCKVSDYGMSQTMFKHGKRDRSSRWDSPETMLKGVFSSEADVWSFGIVLWEIMSFGGRPYPDLDFDDIVKEIASGYKMPRPPHCRNELYTIMSRCWERDAGNRPKIDDVVSDLDKILVQTQESLNYLLLNDLDNDTYHAYASLD